MIEYIEGDIIELTPTRIIIHCGGIGYELLISLNTFSACNGQARALLYTCEVIREDAHLLYGFATKDERELFTLLTSVSGVGPNTARMLLSSYPPDELVQIIAANNETALTAVKGIGLKTAQRILVDLKNKVKPADTPSSVASIPNARVADEATAALVMLGFPKHLSQKAALNILKDSPNLPVEQVIKRALRML